MFIDFREREGEKEREREREREREKKEREKERNINVRISIGCLPYSNQLSHLARALKWLFKIHRLMLC